MKITDIVLASSSPRRREILTMLGIPFRVVVSGADEVISGAASPEEYVLQAAKRKNEAVLERMIEEGSITPDTLIIACDTVVVYNGIVIGKPMGKAGSYAIQQKGASFAERIEGDFYNVVGLPIAALLELLRSEFGIASLDIMNF